MTKAFQPERNPNTHKVHRREVAWQITLPFILGLLIILGLAVWTIISTARGGSVSQEADTSLIFLLIPTMVMSLVPLAIFAGLAYGVIMLNKALPQYSYKAQQAMTKVRIAIRTGADKLVDPIIRFKSILAAFEVLRPKK
jgi:EamA domain-containing membrane protein RarD